jgi:hypothetical protein
LRGRLGAKNEHIRKCGKGSRTIKIFGLTRGIEKKNILSGIWKVRLLCSSNSLNVAARLLERNNLDLKGVYEVRQY